jgi:hypothetical protein
VDAEIDAVVGEGNFASHAHDGTANWELAGEALNSGFGRL